VAHHWRASLDYVLRLLDARTGSFAEVRPGRPGLLRVCAHVPDLGAAEGLTALRVLLLADLLARAAELRKLQVLTTVASGQAPDRYEALEHAAEALGIHPPAARVGPGDAVASLGGPADVHLADRSFRADDRGTSLVALVGTACSELAGEAADGLLAGYEHEPLALRLGLLSFPYDQPANLTAGALADAYAEVGSWRLRVAEWAELPSRPMSAQITEALRDAFGRLDTMAALTLLRSLASDDDLPAGIKFETFVYADRVLGLHLPRDIGRPRVLGPASSPRALSPGRSSGNPCAEGHARWCGDASDGGA
jgi:hypothetical protein